MVRCQSVHTGKSCTRIIWSEHPCQIFTETFPLRLSRLTEGWSPGAAGRMRQYQPAPSESQRGRTPLSEHISSAQLHESSYQSSWKCQALDGLLQQQGSLSCSELDHWDPPGRWAALEWDWFLSGVGNRQYLPTTSCKTAPCHTSAPFSLQCGCRKINTPAGKGTGGAGPAMGGLPDPTNTSQPIPFTSAFRYILCLLYLCVVITCFMYSLHFSRGEMNDGYNIL